MMIIRSIEVGLACNHPNWICCGDYNGNENATPVARHLGSMVIHSDYRIVQQLPQFPVVLVVAPCWLEVLRWHKTVAMFSFCDLFLLRTTCKFLGYNLAHFLSVRKELKIWLRAIEPNVLRTGSLMHQYSHAVYHNQRELRERRAIKRARHLT